MAAGMTIATFSLDTANRRAHAVQYSANASDVKDPEDLLLGLKAIVISPTMGFLRACYLLDE
jgi:hypothetical protein